MSKVPSLPYHQIIRALQRDGWVGQRGRVFTFHTLTSPFALNA